MRRTLDLGPWSKVNQQVDHPQQQASALSGVRAARVAGSSTGPARALQHVTSTSAAALGGGDDPALLAERGEVVSDQGLAQDELTLATR
jgi:hypothetical protein